MQLRFSLLLVFLLGQVTAEASLPDNVTAVIGIPYAKPPLRTFRFEDPQPQEGKLSPISKHSPCFQFTRGKLNLAADHSEDCLYLSLLLPKSPVPKKKINLLVFFSNEKINAEELAKKVQSDLAIAFVSFREGPLGFFRDNENGIKDMHLALKFIKQRVAPAYDIAGKITVIAENDASTVLSRVSDIDESVPYDQTVLLNGNKYGERFSTRRHIVERNADRLLRNVECDLPSPTQSLDCLRTKTVKEIQDGLEAMIFEEAHGAPFQPLSEQTVRNKVPTIVSSQTVLQTEYLSPDEFSSSYSYHDFKRFLALLISEKEFTNAPLLRRLALYEYVHARGEKSDSYFLFEQSRQMIADKHFHTKTWQYVMDLEPTRNNVWLLEYPMQDVLKQCFFEATHEYNEAFCNRLAQYVLRFATKGQPTDGGCNPENPSWPSLKSEKRDYLLVLKEDGQVEWDFDYHKRAAAFWTDLIPAMSKLELAGKRENPFEEVPDLTAYEEEDDVQLWHTLEQPDLTEEKVLNDMPLHFDL